MKYEYFTFLRGSLSGPLGINVRGLVSTKPVSSSGAYTSRGEHSKALSRPVLSSRRRTPAWWIPVARGDEKCYDSLGFSIKSTVSYIFTMKFNYFSSYTHIYNEIQLLLENGSSCELVAVIAPTRL